MVKRLSCLASRFHTKIYRSRNNSALSFASRFKSPGFGDCQANGSVTVRLLARVRDSCDAYESRSETPDRARHSHKV